MEHVALERTAAHVLYVGRLLERALHDTGCWTIQWGPYEVAAERFASEDGISFLARFDGFCWLGEPDTSLILKCDGEVLAFRQIDSACDASFLVTWELARTRVLV